MRFDHISPWRCKCGWNLVLQTDGRVICENSACSTHPKFTIESEELDRMIDGLSGESGGGGASCGLIERLPTLEEYDWAAMPVSLDSLFDDPYRLTGAPQRGTIWTGWPCREIANQSRSHSRLRRLGKGIAGRRENLAFGHWQDEHPTECQVDAINRLKNKLDFTEEDVNSIATMVTGRSTRNWARDLTRGEIDLVLGVLFEHNAMRRRS